MKLNIKEWQPPSDPTSWDSSKPPSNSHPAQTSDRHWQIPMTPGSLHLGHEDAPKSTNDPHLISKENGPIKLPASLLSKADDSQVSIEPRLNRNAKLTTAAEVKDLKEDTSQTQPKVIKRPHRRGYQSVLSAQRVPPLKKRDGEALWREDIQYDFLQAVFSDTTLAFRNPRGDGQTSSNFNSLRSSGSTPFKGNKGTFADVYIDAMACSSKCSRILGEKITGDRDRGVKIAMVCLLVNWGRMNTTLNFFPEMRTVLRTYHPIPSLQTQDDLDYKQLQDAPRLKSILKGACEATSEPYTIGALESVSSTPRTNVINLVFLMSIFSTEVEQRLIPHSSEFTLPDLLMDTTKSSKSRARAFLWLVWAFLEAPTLGDNTSNPFGSKFPELEPLSSRDRALENVDTPAELIFGNRMTLQRLSILDNPEEKPEVAVVDLRTADMTAISLNDHNIDVKSEHGAEHYAPTNCAMKPLIFDDANPELPTLDRPLIMVKPRLRSAKDRRLHDEFNSVVSLKRGAFRRRRLRRVNNLKSLYNRTKHLNQMYETDEDIASVQAFSPRVTNGVYAAGLASKYSDYGECSLSSALALKRAISRLSKPNGT